MMRLIGFLAALLVAGSASASPSDLTTPDDFDHFSVRDPALGEVRWHLDNTNADERGDLIVWLPGSGAYPHFQSFDDGSFGFSFPRQLLAFRDQAHFLLIDKPGLPFSAEMSALPFSTLAFDYRTCWRAMRWQLRRCNAHFQIGSAVSS